MYFRRFIAFIEISLKYGIKDAKRDVDELKKEQKDGKSNESWISIINVRQHKTRKKSFWKSGLLINGYW